MHSTEGTHTHASVSYCSVSLSLSLLIHWSLGVFARAQVVVPCTLGRMSDEHEFVVEPTSSGVLYRYKGQIVEREVFDRLWAERHAELCAEADARRAQMHEDIERYGFGWC